MLCCWAAALFLPAVAELVPGLLELDVVLAPSAPYHVRVGIGQAKFLRLNCMGGPADVVVSLSTYSERADPLLFLSLNPDEPPSFSRHDASSFGQWREDSVGNHYAIAKGVGPRGGILGLVNMRHFAGEELDGVLSIHCSFIVAFDAMFWDHMRSSAICPVGRHLQGGHMVQSEAFCSGQGSCGKHGLCECYSDWEGPACEHAKSDIVTAAEGRYRFEVSTGHYQYFRVHIPPRFPGGYLEVKTSADMPLVVLVRSHGLPTKGNFEISNFDDWVSAHNTSVLRYKVAPSAEFAETIYGGYSSAASSPPLGRRLNSLPRVQCPPANMLPQGDSLACQTSSVAHCKGSCMTCMSCSKGGKYDGGCTAACDECNSASCVQALANCAGNVSCVGIEAQMCDDGCGACINCFDSNDRGCDGCQCCIGCVPLSAKCGAMHHESMRSMEDSRFVFVGVFNHRRYFNDKERVNAISDVKLTADPEYDREELPTSWLAELYDPFHDIGSLEITQRDTYPDGEQYIYDLSVSSSHTRELEVRVFRDRMTLIHIDNAARADFLSLALSSFGGASVGLNITHVLTSSRAAPKTLFDFDRAPVQVGGGFEIRGEGQPSLWCALFGARDGFVRVSARTSYGATTYGNSHIAADAEAGSPFGGVAMLCTGGLLCCSLLALIGATRSGSLSNLLRNLGEGHMSVETSVPADFRQRLSGLVMPCNGETNVEDQYLHRGGIGDDGM